MNAGSSETETVKPKRLNVSSIFHATENMTAYAHVLKVSLTAHGFKPVNYFLVNCCVHCFPSLPLFIASLIGLASLVASTT